MRNDARDAINRLRIWIGPGCDARADIEAISKAIGHAEVTEMFNRELAGGVMQLLSSAPPHMCHRNAAEREAYKRLRATISDLQHYLERQK